MPTTDSNLPLGVKKLIALALIIVGFLLVAAGYRYAYFGTAIGGGLLIIVGIVLLAGKIASRNKGGS